MVKLAANTMAGYSEFYYSDKSLLRKTFDCVAMSGKYILSPELCAQRVCDINKNADIHFIKVRNWSGCGT